MVPSDLSSILERDRTIKSGPGSRALSDIALFGDASSCRLRNIISKLIFSLELRLSDNKEVLYSSLEHTCP
jgi:hypothetical protein